MDELGEKEKGADLCCFLGRHELFIIPSCDPRCESLRSSAGAGGPVEYTCRSGGRFLDPRGLPQRVTNVCALVIALLGPLLVVATFLLVEFDVKGRCTRPAGSSLVRLGERVVFYTVVLNVTVASVLSAVSLSGIVVARWSFIARYFLQGLAARPVFTLSALFSTGAFVWKGEVAAGLTTLLVVWVAPFSDLCCELTVRISSARAFVFGVFATFLRGWLNMQFAEAACEDAAVMARESLEQRALGSIAVGITLIYFVSLLGMLLSKVIDVRLPLMLVPRAPFSAMPPEIACPSSSEGDGKSVVDADDDRLRFMVYFDPREMRIVARGSAADETLSRVGTMRSFALTNAWPVWLSIAVCPCAMLCAVAYAARSVMDLGLMFTEADIGSRCFGADTGPAGRLYNVVSNAGLVAIVLVMTLLAGRFWAAVGRLPDALVAMGKYTVYFATRRPALLASSIVYASIAWATPLGFSTAVAASPIVTPLIDLATITLPSPRREMEGRKREGSVTASMQQRGSGSSAPSPVITSVSVSHSVLRWACVSLAVSVLCAYVRLQLTLGNACDYIRPGLSDFALLLIANGSYAVWHVQLLRAFQCKLGGVRNPMVPFLPKEGVSYDVLGVTFFHAGDQYNDKYESGGKAGGGTRGKRSRSASLDARSIEMRTRPKVPPKEDSVQAVTAL